MIQYLYGTKRVRQTLGSIYLGDLEGDFGKVVNSFMAEYDSYKKYLQSQEVTVYQNYGGYLDGVQKKTVKFDKLLLDWKDTYDNEKDLQVVGERDMDASELAAYEVELAKQKEREIEYLKKLREKYPNV